MKEKFGINISINNSRKLFISFLILNFAAGLNYGCKPSTTDNTTAASPSADALAAKPKPSSTPYPENYHPGYKTKLPDGAIFKNKEIIFTPAKPTYIETISDQFIDYTNYYTVTGMIDGLVKRNKSHSAYVGAGQKVIIDNVRDEPPNPKTVVVPKNFEAKGVYITHTVAGGGYIFKITKEMKKLHLNTVVIDAKDMDGHLSYKSEIPLAKEIGATSSHPPIRNLRKLVEMLHKDGLHVIMRQTLFHDELMGEKKPQYAPVSRSNGKPWKETTRVVWADPSNKTVQDYHLAISKELAEMGVDEIQYDYVRFPAWGNTKDAKYSFDDTKIRKDEIITGFLKRQRENLAPYKVLMSADVYGVVAWDQDVDTKITGQKISDMAKYLDVLSPMLYPSHFFGPFDGFAVPGSEPYHFLYAGVKRTRAKTLGTGVTIRPWIQAFTWKAPNYSPDYVFKQIKATNDAYSGGWLLWNAGNEYKIAFTGIAKFKNKYPTQDELDKKIAASSDKGLLNDKIAMAAFNKKKEMADNLKNGKTTPKKAESEQPVKKAAVDQPVKKGENHTDTKTTNDKAPEKKAPEKKVADSTNKTKAESDPGTKKAVTAVPGKPAKN